MYPSIDTLVKKYDSKYTIAVAAAKRARQLLELSKEKKDPGDFASANSKPVSRALFELEADKIRIEKPKPGKK